MLNKCIIQGRLTADPEIKTVKNIDKCDFTIAVQRSYDREAADFIEVTAWRKSAEFVHKYFAKGQQIIVVGELQSNLYTDKNGVKRKDIRVRASEIHFAGSAKQTSDAPAFEEVEDEDKGNLPF